MFGRIARCRTAVLLIGVFLFGAAQFAADSYAATGNAGDAEAFLQDAQKYLKKGDVNAAIIQLKNALQKSPDNVAAREMLGRIYLSIGNGPNAEKELKVVLKRDAASPRIRFMLAEAYFLQGKFEDVLSVVSDDSSDPEVRVSILQYRGRAYLGLRRLDESEKTFNEAARLRPNLPEPKVGLARIMIMRRKLADSEKLIDGALAVTPKHVNALVLKAELRRLSRDLEGAIANFDKALAVEKRNLPARLGRAAALIDLNRNEPAKADIDAVFARFPNHPLASYLSALILAKKKDFAGAQEVLQRGGRLLDNHLPSLFLSGATSYALNQIEQSVRSLTLYVERAPGNVRAVKLLAAALIRAGQPGKAAALLQPVIDKGSKDAQILSLAGSAYMRTGNFNKGTALFGQAAELAPDVASIRTQLALGRLFSGQSDQAVSDLEAAVDLDPGANRASILLTLVQLRKGKFDDALKSTALLQEKLPDNPMPLNLMGAALLGKGDTAKARDAFEQALKLKPDFHPARMNLGQLDLREKKIESAIAQFKLIIEKDPKHANAMLALATIAETRKRPRDALSWLQQAGEANPSNVLPQLRIIQHHGRNRDFQKAVAVARELAQRHPRNPRVLVALGRTETSIGEHGAAVAAFRRLADLAPKSARAFAMLAGAQAAAKDRESARDSLKKAILLDPNAETSRVALAKLEARAGRTDEALKIAESLQKDKPRSAAGFVLAGDVYTSMKKYDQALTAYRAGQERADTEANALRRFSAERLAGRVNEAFSALQAWVDGKGSRKARFFLASAYINAKRFDDAIRETEMLLGKEENNPILLNNLAWLYDQKGDEKALGMARKALEKAPKSSAIMDTLGWILVRKGQIGDAVPLLEKASELAPNQGDIAYHHAVALDKAGKSREARRKLKKLLGSGVKFSEVENAEALLKKLGG